jgi:hypothetical protein
MADPLTCPSARRGRRSPYPAALAVAAGIAVTLCAVPARAADPQHEALGPDRLNGTWDRWHAPDAYDPRVTGAPPAPAPPLKPEYKLQWEARQKAAHEADLHGQPLYSGYAQCLPDGMPAMMMAMFPMEVLQTPGQITIIEEAYNQVRRIYLDEKQIGIEDAEPGFWGHSVGHWEGGTLVVNTVGIKESVRFRDAPHSDQMQIDERIRLISKDVFEDQVTVTDPVYLTGPWKFSWKYVRKPKYKILEYVCESNREYQDPQTGGTRLKLGGGTSEAQPAQPPAK